MARGGAGIIRRPADTQRQFRSRFTLRSATELVADVPAGHGAFAVTAGQFQFGEWLLAWLDRYQREPTDGPAKRLLITAWAIGDPGVRTLSTMAEEIGGERPIWLLIDPHQARGSYRKHLDAVAEHIGRDSIRLISMHAKLAVLGGTDLVMASSANLSGAPRSEWMMTVRDRGFADALGGFWDEIFEGLPPWRGEDTSVLPLKEQVRMIREAAERHDMPAGAIAAVQPEAVRFEAPRGEPENWKTAPAKAPPSAPAEDDEVGPERVVGGSRGRIAAMRRGLAMKMERPRLRTMGEIAAGAKAERELIEAEARLGGADVELARAVLRAVEKALVPRSYRERVKVAREGVRRVVESIGRGGGVG